MGKNDKLCRLMILALFLITSCNDDSAPCKENLYTRFGKIERVTISGYSGNIMEPFISRDGKLLYFNNENTPGIDTNIHFAEKLDNDIFLYKGELRGVNTSALEGTPSADNQGRFYFISTRNYQNTLSSVYSAQFNGNVCTDALFVPGIAVENTGYVYFDVEVSSDGNSLYLSRGLFKGGPVPERADIALAYKTGDGFALSSESEEIFENVNSKALEYAAALSSDELELFFTRWEGKGFPSIYRSARSDRHDPFGLPEKVASISGFAEGPSLSSDGRDLYFHKKEGDRFVLYRVSR